MKTDIVIDVFALAAAACATGKEVTRPYLQCVFVSRDETGTTYVGCDGHVALYVRDELTKGSPAQALVPPALLAGKPKKRDFKFEKLVVDHLAGTVSLAGRYDSYPADMTYPDMVRIIPDRAAVVTGKQVQVSPITYAQLAKAADILAGSKKAFFRILPSGGLDDPAIATISAGDYREAFSVVMPLRCDNDVTWERPVWTATALHKAASCLP